MERAGLRAAGRRASGRAGRDIIRFKALKNLKRRTVSPLDRLAAVAAAGPRARRADGDHRAPGGLGAVRPALALAHLLAGLLGDPVRRCARTRGSSGRTRSGCCSCRPSTSPPTALPTFFIHEPGQFFYPIQLFYAGPMLAGAGLPRDAVRRLAGVRRGHGARLRRRLGRRGLDGAQPRRARPRWRSSPACCSRRAPYFVSNLYGRGAWAEFVALGRSRVALGAATSLLAGARAAAQPDHRRAGARGRRVAGTHNLTLLFGAILAVPLLLRAAAVDARGPAAARRRRSSPPPPSACACAACSCSPTRGSVRDERRSAAQRAAPARRRRGLGHARDRPQPAARPTRRA